ncbi:uncharacterized protein DUF58 [Azomonas agilis]|uniref:Uncharacterized protein DUF58 n=1 Tax=Azomonas agilis TaxID=116849 RepID=A0A562I1S1_9GAMM|nr:DUF58 domain-containing protein [Azomonas agilis]TWH64902.1 uncharacterized protein DUF58 [Azomonas agilis]
MMTPCIEGVTTNLSELIALRQHIHKIPLFSTPQRRSLLLGHHHARLRGRGVDFDQVRPYQVGDDVRHVDWRVTARTREPHTKIFHEERERPIYLLVEQSPRLFFGTQRQFKSVLAAQAAALIGWVALEHCDRVGGLVFSQHQHQEVRPRRRQHSLLQFLQCLAQANQQLAQPLSSTTASSTTDSLSFALHRTREVLRPGSLVVLLCDERALTDLAEQQLKLLGRHLDLLLLPLSDPLDHRLPRAGLLDFTEQDSYLSLNTHDRSVRNRYRRYAEARQQRWVQLAHQLNTPHLPLSTQRGVIEQLHDYLTSTLGA